MTPEILINEVVKAHFLKTKMNLKVIFIFMQQYVYQLKTSFSLLVAFMQFLMSILKLIQLVTSFGNHFCNQQEHT